MLNEVITTNTEQKTSADDFTAFSINGRTVECNNRSKIAIDGCKVSCKVFVYIKDGDTDTLSVNHRVEAVFDESGSVRVHNIEVIDARIPNSEDDRDYIQGFAWADSDKIKEQMNLYLAGELLEY